MKNNYYINVVQGILALSIASNLASCGIAKNSYEQEPQHARRSPAPYSPFENNKAAPRPLGLQYAAYRGAGYNPNISGFNSTPPLTIRGQSNLAYRPDPRLFAHNLDNDNPAYSYNAAQSSQRRQISSNSHYATNVYTPQPPQPSQGKNLAYLQFQPEPSVSLNRSWSNAFQTSPQIAAEKIKIKEADEELLQAKAGSLLKSELRGSVGGKLSDTSYRIINRNDTDFRVGQSVEVNLSLPIFQGGRAKSAKRTAKANIHTAKANLNKVEGEVLQSTALAYLDVVRDRKLVGIYRQNVTLLAQQLHNAQILLSQKENTITDIALINTRLTAVQIDLETVLAALSSSESRYHTLVGIPAPSLLPVPRLQIPRSLYEVKAIVQKNNPELQSIQARAEAAKHAVGFAKSSSKPTLTLQGVLRGARGQSETIEQNTAAEVLLALKIPLLSGGENKSKVRQAKLAKSRSILETYAAHQALNERTEQLWANLQATKRNRVLNQQQIGTAQLAFNSLSRQRDAGLATILDVLSVEQTLLNAQINTIRAENNEMVTRIQLLNLMGALSQESLFFNAKYAEAALDN